MVQIVVLTRLDRGKTQQKLVVSRLLLAHCWVICPFGLLPGVSLQIACRVSALQSFLGLYPRDGAAVTRVQLAPIELRVVFNDTGRAAWNAQSSSRGCRLANG